MRRGRSEGTTGYHWIWSTLALLLAGCGATNPPGSTPTPAPSPTAVPTERPAIAYILGARDLRTFSVDGQTGAFTPVAQAELPSSHAWAVRPEEGRVYVATIDSLHLFRTDASAQLSPVAAYAIGGASTHAIQLAFAGDFMYVGTRAHDAGTHGAVDFYRMDPTTGGISKPLGTVNYIDPIFVGSSPDAGRVYSMSGLQGQTSVTSSRIREDGMLVSVGTWGFATPPEGVQGTGQAAALSPSGRFLLLYDGAFLRSFAVGDKDEPLERWILRVPTTDGEKFRRIVVHPGSGFVALADDVGVRLFSMAATTGELVQTDDLSLPGKLHYASWDVEGGFFYVAVEDAIRIFTFDVETGKLSPVGEVTGVTGDIKIVRP